MNPLSKRLRLSPAPALMLSLAALALPAQAAVVLDTATLSYSQDFNSLPSAGPDPVWTNNVNLPGWYIFAGPNLDTPVSNLRVSTSSGSDRAHISYGLPGDSERAFGSQAGSSHRYSPVTPDENEAFGAIAVAFANGSGSVLDGFSFSYTGEQWHVSTNANTDHALVMAYAVGSADTAFHLLDWQSFSAEQTNAAGVHFYTPTISGGVTGNGHLDANRTTGLGATVSGLSWAPGDVLWLRWVDFNDRASDHGMAIDDFSIAVTPVPEPAMAWTLLAGLGGLLLHRRCGRSGSARREQR